MPLNDQRRAQLDGIVQQMHGNGESDDSIQAVVNDFKTKYGADAQSQQPDMLEQALNYRTGSNLIDAPMGVVQGAAKGLLSTAYNGSDLLRKIPGVATADDYIRSLYGGQKATPEQEAAMTKANGIGQGTGKFLEQGAEYAMPAAMASKALKGTSLLARLAGQAGASAGVAGVQSGGDEGNMALAGGLGAAGTFAPEVVPFAKKAVGYVLGSDPDAHTMVMQALRPSQNNVFFAKNLSRSMPDLKAVEQHLGKPIESLDDLLGGDDGGQSAIQLAKQLNRQAYNSMFPSGAVGTDLSPVADAIESTITKRMAMQDPAKAQAIRNLASKYRGTFSVEDVDGFLRDANRDLDSYYDKNPAARKGALGNADTAATVAEAKALRSQIYNSLDRDGQGEAAAELQKRYGALNELEEAAMKRKNVMLRQAPENLAQQMSKVAAAMKMVKGGAKIVTGNPLGGSMDIGEAVAGSKMANYLKTRNSTDDLIRRAFAGYDKTPSPIEMPRTWTGVDEGVLQDLGARPMSPNGRVQARALLEQVHRMPGVADSSGPIPNTGPYMGRGMSPDYGGRLLEAPAGPIRYTEGVADSSGPIPGGPRPGAGISPEIGNRMLPPAESVQTPGFAVGEDMVPVRDSKTGKVTYLPKWMTETPLKQSGAREAKYRNTLLTRKP